MDKDEPVPAETRFGPFSVGDIIALGAVLITTGGGYANLLVVMKEQDRQAIRLQALEQVVPSKYVQKDEYRDEMQEIKKSISEGFKATNEGFYRIEAKIDRKVDK